jgi:hypothetical protein
MKIISVIFLLLIQFARSEDSYFFTLANDERPTSVSVENENLHLVMKIKRLPLPKARSIIAFHQGLGGVREYKIQIDLAEAPPEGVPMLKLGDDLIMEGVSVETPNNPKFASSISIEVADSKQVTKLVSALAGLLKLPKDRIEIHLDKAGQPGPDQPATKPAWQAA